MSEIRAFVGHSFTEDDKAVVASFLKYFDQVSNILPSFSWQNAETAEPKDLADKVLSLIADKNVFIGICTKKERVLRQRQLKKAWFRDRSFVVEEKSFEWKTSDWIIQEIGLAIGRGLSLILLVEDGVRIPGGLQGNMEYVPFDREFPEKCCGKLIEMLTALSPRAPVQTLSADTQALQDKRDEPETPPDRAWKTPQPDWGRMQYEIACMRMIATEDFEGADTIDAAYLESSDGAKGDNAHTWRAFVEYMKLTFGKGGSFAKLQDLALEFPDNSEILEYLARGYGEYKDRANAAATYKAAASKSTNNATALRLMRHAAEEYAYAGMSSSAARILAEMKDKSVDAASYKGREERWLLEAIRWTAEVAKEDDVVLAAMERMVELDPSSTDARFELAYKHSQSGNNDLALFHYLKIPEQQRHSGTWNNLGVAFDHFSMPGRSVSAYRKAEALGNTLAMGNLAHKFLSRGFLKEAQAACDKALAIEGYHQSVAQALAKVREVPFEESQKEKEAVEKAKPKSLFYARLGRAASEHEPKEIAENWEGPDCALKVSIRDGNFKAVGAYEVKQAPGLLALSFLTGGHATNGEMDQFTVEYSGVLRGCTIEGHVARAKVGEPVRAATLLGAPSPVKVLLFLSHDGSKLSAIENPQSTDPSFYSLKRKDSVSVIKLERISSAQAPEQDS